MSKESKARIKHRRECRKRWTRTDHVLRWVLRWELKTRRPFRHDLERLHHHQLASSSSPGKILNSA
jgi:hypothetical protein